MLAVMTLLLIVVVVCYYNWLAALFLVLAAPLIPLFMVLVGLGAESVNQRFFLQRQRLAGHFLDRVKYLTTLKLFAAQTAALNEVQQRSDDYRKVVIKTLKLAFLSSAVLEFFTSVAIATIAIYIGFALLGSISWGPRRVSPYSVVCLFYCWRRSFFSRLETSLSFIMIERLRWPPQRKLLLIWQTPFNRISNPLNLPINQLPLQLNPDCLYQSFVSVTPMFKPYKVRSRFSY